VNARRWAIVGAAVLILVILIVSHRSTAASSSPGSSIAISLNVVPTTRSITVTPSTAAFSHCGGGTGDFASQQKALGYPNGHCFLGRPGASYPVLIKNTGSAAKIEVYGGNADPSDLGAGWALCNLPPHPAVACKGLGGTAPGQDQYLLESFSANGTINGSGLTTQPACDTGFAPAGGCIASRAQAQNEGIEIIGPAASHDLSTSWTVTVTWLAAPP
jgi:hypothetical protein